MRDEQAMDQSIQTVTELAAEQKLHNQCQQTKPMLPEELPDSVLLENLGSDMNHSRFAGHTEHSWCKAVSGGTGITIISMLFHLDAEKTAMEAAQMETALREVQQQHPLLRSRLVWIRGRPAFSVSPAPFLSLEVLQAPSVGDIDMANNSDRNDRMTSLQVLERELNMNAEWVEQYHCLEPVPMLTARLYDGVRHEHRTAAAAAPTQNGRTIANCSLLVLRFHTAICDRASAAIVFKDLIHIMHRNSRLGTSEYDQSTTTYDSVAAGPSGLQAVEDLIPKGMADKPFWVHGLDILGYSLGSRRHAMLPFQSTDAVPDQRRTSHVICRKLGVPETQKLLQDCESENTNLVGALTAAVLKATVASKNLGLRASEHHAVVTFLDCRPILQPVLPTSAVGFYHSAILNTHGLHGGDEFWEIARRCSTSVEDAIKRRKHFTDMGDLAMLMCQAMRMPHLTPSSSLRTATLALFHDLDGSYHHQQDSSIASIQQELGLLESIGCSSIHGVGPSIAIFHALQNGELILTCVFPSPLHSHKQISELLNIVMSILM